MNDIDQLTTVQSSVCGVTACIVLFGDPLPPGCGVINVIHLLWLMLFTTVNGLNVMVDRCMITF